MDILPEHCMCVVFVCCRPATPSKTPPPPDDDSTTPSPAPTPPPRPVTPSEPVSELKLTEPHKFEIPRLKSPVKKFAPSPPTKPKRFVLYRFGVSILASWWRLLRLFVVNSNHLKCISLPMVTVQNTGTMLGHVCFFTFVASRSSHFSFSLSCFRRLLFLMHSFLTWRSCLEN